MITGGFDEGKIKLHFLNVINLRSPWIDPLTGGPGCDFEWHRADQCLRTKKGMSLLTASERNAFENYVRDLCAELRKTRQFNLKVFDVEGSVTFTKCVFPSWVKTRAGAY